MADQIKLPPDLLSRQSPAGTHHLGLKALWYGPAKSGKSFALASYPHPIFAIACGENGIELYLKPELGDVSVYVDDADSYTKALEFGLRSNAASIVVDGINLAFEDWMASWEDKLGVDELKGKHWRSVKDPWKSLHRRVMNSAKHFGCSAWPKGVKYVEETESSGIPGVEGKKKLTILEQDAPHVERMIPFAVDMTLKTEIELDKKFAPTSIHRITYMGGRRPVSIPANELYTGKFWRFDSKKVGEESPFDKVLKPIIEKWQVGAVEYVGIDAGEAGREVAEADRVFQDGEVGRMVQLLQDAKTMDELRSAFTTIQAGVNALSPKQQATVVAAKDRRKAELGG